MRLYAFSNISFVVRRYGPATVGKMFTTNEPPNHALAQYAESRFFDY